MTLVAVPFDGGIPAKNPISVGFVSVPKLGRFTWQVYHVRAVRAPLLPSPSGASLMVFPELTHFSDLGLLLLRLMVSLVFFTSGFNHIKDPVGRSKSIGMSKSFTIFLGAAEVLGSLGVAFGVLIQPAAIGLILIMLGAIQKKIFVWHIEFWANNGWNYELMLVVMSLVILFTGGGKYVLWA